MSSLDPWTKQFQLGCIFLCPLLLAEVLFHMTWLQGDDP